MAEIIDFDAYRREREAQEGEAQPNTFRIGGEDYPYPSEPPAELVLDILRLQRDLGDGSEVPVTALVSIGDSVFGQEEFSEMLRKNKVRSSELGHLIMSVIRSWGLVDDEIPNPTPPEGALTS